MIGGGLGVVQLHPHGHLVFLNASLQLSELVDLLRHLGNRILEQKKEFSRQW